MDATPGRECAGCCGNKGEKIIAESQFPTFAFNSSKKFSTTIKSPPDWPDLELRSINRTVLDESYKVAFRRRIYATLKALQNDLGAYLARYNTERTHQGERCQGRTPMQIFLDSRSLAWEKKIA